MRFKSKTAEKNAKNFDICPDSPIKAADNSYLENVRTLH